MCPARHLGGRAMAGWVLQGRLGARGACPARSAAQPEEVAFPLWLPSLRPQLLKNALQRAVEKGQLEQITGKGASGTFQVGEGGFCLRAPFLGELQGLGRGAAGPRLARAALLSHSFCLPRFPSLVVIL